jgi:XisH protein
MPAKDIYHDTVRTALVKDGWTITKDPFKLTFGGRNLYVDLGAEKLFGAEKGEQKIAVEIKSFLDPSPINDLEKALGQYKLYSQILEDIEPNRLLYLAVGNIVFEDFFSEPICQLVIRKNNLNIIVFEPNKQEIIQWIN